MTTFKLLKKLERADRVCEPCGMDYGQRGKKLYSLLNGTCDVCGDETFVANASNWGYLRKGRIELLHDITDKLGLDA